MVAIFEVVAKRGSTALVLLVSLLDIKSILLTYGLRLLESPKNGGNMAILGQIWLNFGFKKLQHVPPSMLSEALSVRFLDIHSASSDIEGGTGCNFIFFSHSHC